MLCSPRRLHPGVRAEGAASPDTYTPPLQAWMLQRADISSPAPHLDVCIQFLGIIPGLLALCALQPWSVCRAALLCDGELGGFSENPL